MSLYTHADGATSHPEEVLDFLTSRLITASGVFDVAGGELLVSEADVPAMSVKVASGYAFLQKADLTKTYPVYVSVDDSVTISANASGNSRIDAVVLYYNNGATPNANSTGVATLVAIQGTPAGSPVAPTDGAIETAIGASNPFIRLANVTVASGAVSIVDANIADTRTEATYSDKVRAILLDEDTMASNSATEGATQQSIKAYVDNGWGYISDAWTYASANTINVPTGAGSRHQIGDKLRFKQGAGYKYYVISAVADTLLTIAVNTDYTVANSAITEIYYSREASPIGFPTAFAFTPAFTGFSSVPTGQCYYSTKGRECTVYILADNPGVSNATGLGFTIPFASLSGSSYFAGLVYNNSAWTTVPGRGSISGSTVAVGTTPAGGAWTGSNNKMWLGQFVYAF